MMQTSQNGIELIKEFEGFEEIAYPCSAGVWTIGYGTTKWFGNRAVRRGDTIDKATALKLLRHDLEQFEKQVNFLVDDKILLTQNQFDALVSFTYNLGGAALEKSTLLKKLNKGDYKGAAKQFMKWVYASDPKTGKKRKVGGLVNRRKREMELFSDQSIKEPFMAKFDYQKPDSNNTPLRNRDLPLPTAYQEHGADSVYEKKTSPAVVTASAGGAIAGGVGIAQYAEHIPTAFSFLQNADYRVALVVVGVVIIGGVVYFVRRWWR